MTFIFLVKKLHDHSLYLVTCNRKLITCDLKYKYMLIYLIHNPQWKVCKIDLATQKWIRAGSIYLSVLLSLAWYFFGPQAIASQCQFGSVCHKSHIFMLLEDRNEGSRKTSFTLWDFLFKDVAPLSSSGLHCFWLEACCYSYFCSIMCLIFLWLLLRFPFFLLFSFFFSFHFIRHLIMTCLGILYLMFLLCGICCFSWVRGLQII